jgi:hypothetical protein
MFVLLFPCQQEHKYFEDAFKVYERGVKIFKYPHVKAIWVTYLTKFVQRYKRSKLERARELFHEAVQQVREVTPMLCCMCACLSLLGFCGCMLLRFIKFFSIIRACHEKYLIDNAIQSTMASFCNCKITLVFVLLCEPCDPHCLLIICHIILCSLFACLDTGIFFLSCMLY